MMAGPWRSCHEPGVGVGTLTLKKPCVIFSTLKVWKEAQRGEGMHLRIPGQREQRSWDLPPGSGVLGVHYAGIMAEHRTLECGQGGGCMARSGWWWFARKASQKKPHLRGREGREVLGREQGLTRKRGWHAEAECGERSSSYSGGLAGWASEGGEKWMGMKSSETVYLSSGEAS